jgi:hypothetical protein
MINIKQLFSLIIISFCVLLVSFINFFNYLNPDGTLYIKQAMMIGNGESFESILNFYAWPFYSYFIYFLSTLLSHDYILSAKLLSYVSIFILSIYFTKTINYLFPKIYFLIPLFSFFSLGFFIRDYGPMVIRDNLFWALLVVTIYYSIKFIKCNKFNLFIYALIFSFLSSLIRPEGILFFIYIFVYFFIKNQAIRNLLFLKILSLIFISFFIFFFINDFGRLNEFISLPMKLFNNFILGISIPINSENEFLDLLIQQNPNSFIFSGLTIIFLTKLFFNKASIFILISFLKVKKINKDLIEARNFLLSLSLLFGFIAYVYTLSTFIITTRYIVPVLLIFTLLSFFKLNYLSFFVNKSKYILLFLIVVTIFSLRPFKFENYQDTLDFISLNNLRDSDFYSNVEMIYFRSENYFPEFKWDELEKAIESNVRYLILSDIENIDSEIIKKINTNYSEVHTLDNFKSKVNVFLINQN